MANQYDPNSATTTDFSGAVETYSPDAVTPDLAQQAKGETVWDFPQSSTYLGYYDAIPEIKSALKVFSMRVCGMGYTASYETQPVLESIRGSGTETFDSIMQAMVREKKYLGDSVAHIIRNQETGTIINLKRLWLGNMRVVYDDKGFIKRWEQRVPNKDSIKFSPEEIFHLSNDRYSNANHGTPITVSLKKIIDAKQEALDDERKIKHRELALGIAYYDTDDSGKISFINTQIENAVKNGEMLGLPKDTVEIQAAPTRSASDKIQWLQYLDNLFYQVVGIPKVLVTSEGYTEAGGKAGLLAFEPTEIAEKTELEKDIWNQLALRVSFTRSPSITTPVQQSEAKNTGQTNLQPNESQVGLTRNT